MDVSYMQPSANGHAQQGPQGPPLLDVLTEGYRPNLPGWAYALDQWQYMLPIYLYREIEVMRIHPIVRNALRSFRSGISGAAFEGPKDAQGTPKPISQNPAVTEFVMSMCRRFWDRGVPKLQNGYDYGWIACENVYGERQGGPQDGLLEWEGCKDFHPLHCFLLTQDAVPVGARITNITRGDHPKGKVDLWFSEGAIPGKAMWYAHLPRFNPFYGESQLLGAWRPYRRLAAKDAAETVLDGGFYRGSWSGPLVRFPQEDLQAPSNVPNVTNSDGLPFKYSRDYAKFMADQAKSGASIGLPSDKYPQEFGGDFKWTYEWPENHFNGEPLIVYVEHLIKQVREGVGVPNELIEAAETGSGYSGRAIPLEGFMQIQQEIANSMLQLFVIQCLKPLVLYNRDYFQQYGPIDFEVVVANLLETKLKMAMNPGGAAPEMRAEGQPQDAGQQGATQPQQPGEEGTTWKPHQDENTGKQGWMSSQGLVRYTQTPPGATSQGQLSLNSQDVSKRLQAIARAILGQAA